MPYANAMKLTIKQILFLFAGVSLFISGCATSPPKIRETNFLNAKWESKAVIKNLKTGGVNSISIDIMAIRNSRARFEITGPFGIQVASLVMSPQDISFIYFPNKEFYYGKNSERALRALVDLPLHPMNLSYVAFDEPIGGPGWTCAAGVDHMVESCQQTQRGLRVKWVRNGEEKKIVISTSDIEMSWFFKAAQTSVQFKPAVFTLAQPEGFKAIQLH